MRKIIFFLIILSASFTIAQTKYMIYFKDKGITPTASLKKSSSLYKIAEKQLSPQAIERRKQVMGEDNYVTYEDIPLSENYIHQVEALGIRIANKLKWFNAVSAYLTDNQLSRIKELSCIEKIEGVRVFKTRIDENNLNDSNGNPSIQPLKKTSSATGLNYGPSLTQNTLSDIPAVHDLGINGNGVIIGILDTGFRWKSHNSLKNLVVLGEKDFIQNDGVTENQLGDRSDQDGHGTAVFSIMAGFDQGNIVGPVYGAQFLLAKTEYVPTETNVEEDNYAAALEWMEAQGVQITSSSLGYTLFDTGQSSYNYADMNGNTTIVSKAANLAFDRGVSTFTAAGNDGNNAWRYISSPGDAFDILTIGALNSNNTVANFSSRGPTSDGRIKPEVSAMGVNVYNASVGTAGYSFGSGTSFATPIAAGIGALLKSVYPHLTNRQIRKIFIECGDNSANPDNDRGYGLISAKRVVSYPNLSKENNAFKLNKIFIDANGINSSSIKLNYKVSNSSFQNISMNRNDTLKYDYTFPVSTSGDSVGFFFKYLNNSGLLVREPSVGSYNFSYGDLLISYNPRKVVIEPIPDTYQLLQNYPNPFNLSTVISYQLAARSSVSLKIYDMLGREIATLVNEYKQPGTYSVNFNVETRHASSLPSGVYFYQLLAGDFVKTKKMILLK